VFVVLTFLLSLASEYPVDKQLQVHLENEQCILFNMAGRMSIEVCGKFEDMQLTVYFKANKQYLHT
jgi:hypothetical protein